MVSKMIFPRLIFASIFIACCLTDFSLGQTLPTSEVEALRNITDTLGKKGWNFNDPCSKNVTWFENGDDSPTYTDNIICNCTLNSDSTCHITHVVFKGQGLSGTLPPALVNLSFLQEIDLTRNYLNGTIPSEWGSMHLIKINLLGNRLTGPIPKELGKLSNLTVLVVEHNKLSGTLPSALGDLPNIEQLYLGFNNFTGKLPESFAKLTTLRKFKISDNSFTGSIPNFIFQNWTNLEEIYIEGSGLSGPIPNVSDIASLKYMIIGDLNGGEIAFPKLNNLTNLDRLMLRNCNITGELPASVGELPNVKILDVSFNKLNGNVPDLESLPLDNLFLTGNMFNGKLPVWIRNSKESMDASYNNFTDVSECNVNNNVNLFSSTSSPNNSGIVSCLSSTTCPEEALPYLYINCGGQEVVVNDTTYDADTDITNPSEFHRSPSGYWAISSTGIFLNDGGDDILEVTNKTFMSAGEPYTSARRAANSLTYYAFCLKNITYKVDLHFAELQFIDGQNYSSLGRRIFDVYIQGNRVLENFNIMDEAGGAQKPYKESLNVNVSDGTLEIQLRWAGKGTNAIPERGIYGPLISGISILDPDYVPPKSGGGISTAAVVSIVVGVLAFVFILILGILWWNGCLIRQTTLEQELKGVELNTSSFSLRQIKAATNNFDAANKIGEGGFGPVYKGTLADGTVIAVKQLSARSKQGNREFVTEIGMISALQHPYLVKLYGCCIEGNQLLLILPLSLKDCPICPKIIYEYMENNSLARALFGSEEFQLKLDWATRRKICIGIAKGLAYLHEESRLKIVHRDIKANNVLLDKNLNPKISDFGLAKLNEEDDTHITTRVAGTYGYMAPEYAMHGHLTDKADVYSFGIVTLEIVSGKSNRKNNAKKEDPVYLLEWVHILKEHGSLLDLVDPRIGSDCNTDQVMAMINVALLCTNLVPAARPSMSTVVSVLEGRTNVQDIITEHLGFRSTKSNVEAVKKLYQQLEGNEGENSQTKSVLADGPWTSSSTSAADLYPINLSSGYLHNRDSIM